MATGQGPLNLSKLPELPQASAFDAKALLAAGWTRQLIGWMQIPIWEHFTTSLGAENVRALDVTTDDDRRSGWLLISPAGMKKIELYLTPARGNA